MSDKGQADFYDDKDYKTDIQDLYDTFIGFTDTLRSRFPLLPVGEISEKLLQDVRNASRVMPDNTPQESRCNAFYRLLGLPIIDPASDSFYNPGYSPQNNQPDVILSKIQIANSVLADRPLLSILNKREAFPNSQLSKLVKKDINASAMAYSTRYLRPVKDIFTDGNPLAAEEQIFTSTSRSSTSLNYAESVNFSTALPHILKPFMSHPLVDFNIFPFRNQVAVPFLTEVERRDKYIPYIQVIANVRLSTRNKSNDAVAINKIIESVKSNTKITDKTLLNSIGGAAYYRGEVFIFSQILKLFKVIVDTLDKSVRTINEVDQYAHWMPIPSSDGTDSGITLFESDAITSLGRPLDIEIDRLQKNSILANSEIDLLKLDLGVSTKSVVRGQAFAGIDKIIFGSVISSIPKSFDDKIQKLTDARSHYLDRANFSLENISQIMGDFTGMGLIDMISIYAALWTISREALVALLDQYAFERLYKITELRSSAVEARQGGTGMPIKDAIKELQTKIIEMLSLFDIMIETKRKNG